MKIVFHRDKIIDSTNLWAMKYINSTAENELHVFCADFQTKGRGQGDHLWNSESGENILMSILYKKPPIEVVNQFTISHIIAVAAHNYISAELTDKNISIKWPNDILIDNLKVAGILVENALMGNKIMATVIGIGVNINQINFGENLNSAVSLRMIDGKIRCVETEIKKLINFFTESLNNFIELGIDKMHKLYDQRMFGIGTEQKFKLNDNIINCYIIGSETNGQIRLRLPDGSEKSFYHHEISMCYNHV